MVAVSHVLLLHCMQSVADMTVSGGHCPSESAVMGREEYHSNCPNVHVCTVGSNTVFGSIILNLDTAISNKIHQHVHLYYVSSISETSLTSLFLAEIMS